jgi:dihydrofolate synthase/folylpolyglutamate synthase
LNYREALTWLFGTQRFGIKLGLENSRRLFAALGVPSPNDRIIHVAGTNGKGSVCAMIDAICRAQGYRTGLFTSPHLVTFRERIQLSGELIDESAVAHGLTIIRELAVDWQPHPTFFELTTALGLYCFQQAHCDLIILETGMGGRLDATNATQPIVSVITPIDLDHQKWLGETLEKIAGEKAGIIKPGAPVVSAAQKSEVENVLRTRARECSTPLHFITAPYEESALSLPGGHQRENAALAVAALRVAEIEVTRKSIGRGLAAIVWPARFQRFKDRIVIDGAHNVAGARVLAKTWREVFGAERATLIFGVFRDKEVAAIFRELASIAATIYLPVFRGERALPPNELRTMIAAVMPGIPRCLFPSTADALQSARQNQSPILVAGSLHLAGEALALLRGEPAAFEECAQ